MQVGDKFEPRGKIQGVIEIIGIYPNYSYFKEDSYEIMVGSQKTILSESLINLLFEKIENKVVTHAS